MTSGEIDYHPLWIVRIVFTRERFREIGVAFPVSFFVAVGDARVSVRIGAVVARETAMRKEVPERVADDISRFRVTDVITSTTRIAPSALRIPVPGFNKQFRVLAVGYRLPTRRQNTELFVERSEEHT